MEYDKILKDLENIVDKNFTMKEFRDLSILFIRVNCQYGKELLAKREDAKERFEEVYERVYDVAFNNLKDKLGFEDEVIDRIITLMENHDNLDDIYVIDGNVIGEITKGNSFIKNETNIFLLQPGFMDITSNSFNNGNTYYNELLVNAFNSLLRTIIKVNNGNLLEYKDGLINCKYPNLSIYANHSLDDIMNDTEGLQDTEIIIKYYDRLFSFDMKIINNCISFMKNDYQVNILSSMLNEDTKVYKK